MTNFNKIESWYESTDLLRKETGFKCQMTREDHGFLCGIIKLVRPRKILEVGVAEGGTTAVIIKSLEILGLRCDVFSIDLNKQLYYDNSFETGYIYKKRKMTENVNHTFLFGKAIASRLDEIGGEIDLVILDTTHVMPGEILDFLSVLPFLAQNAMVVLHDVNVIYDGAWSQNYEEVKWSMHEIATKVLYTTAVAEKYWDYNSDYLYNIAALKVNEDTYKNIIDMFIALSCVWPYPLDEQMLQEYRNLFVRHYSPQCIEIFDVCVKTNHIMYEKLRTWRKNKQKQRKISKNKEKISKKCYIPYEDIPCGSKLVLYGAGFIGEVVSFILQVSNYATIVSLVDTDYKQLYEVGNFEVESPYSILEKEFDIILITVESTDLFREIKKYILENNLNKGKKIIGPIKFVH